MTLASSRMVQGSGNIFYMDTKNTVHHVLIKDRIPRRINEHCFFIDNVNLHKLGHTYNFRGVLICLKQDIFKLAMVLLMNYKVVVIIKIKSINIFTEQECNDNLQSLFRDYFDQPEVYSLEQFTKIKVYYLNQISGRRPFGIELEDATTPNDDNCYRASINGPDILLPLLLLQKCKVFRKILRPFQYNNNIFEGDIVINNINHKKKKILCNGEFLSIPRIFTSCDLNFKIRNMYINLPNSTEITNTQEISNLFAIPIINSSRNDPNVTFCFLDKKDTCYMLKQGTQTIAYHNRFLVENSRYIKNVHILSMMEKNNKISFQVGISEVFEHNCIKKEPTVGVSYYEISSIIGVNFTPSSDNVKIFTDLIKKTYGNNSFGNRCRSLCFGTNIYTGLRGSKCVRPSPRMSQHQIEYSQYTNMKWNFTCMPLVQKTINTLANNAINIKKKLSPLHDHLVNICCYDKKIRMRDYRGHCRLSICTLGDSHVIGYCNTPHVDKKDRFSRKRINNVLCILRNELSMLDTTHEMYEDYNDCIKYIELYGIGVLTTCGYICYGTKPNMEIKAYFLLVGINIGFEISTCLYHNFRGDIFSHMTSVPVIVNGTNVKYNSPDIGILAWGSGGPHTD